MRTRYRKHATEMGSGWCHAALLTEDRTPIFEDVEIEALVRARIERECERGRLEVEAMRVFDDRVQALVRSPDNRLREALRAVRSGLASSWNRKYPRRVTRLLQQGVEPVPIDRYRVAVLRRLDSGDRRSLTATATRLIDLRAGVGSIDGREVEELQMLCDESLLQRLAAWSDAAEAVGAGIPLITIESNVRSVDFVPDDEWAFYTMREDGGDEVFMTLRDALQATVSATTWRDLGLHGGTRSGTVHRRLREHVALLDRSEAYARTAVELLRRLLRLAHREPVRRN